jgi:hypothetical protein
MSVIDLYSSSKWELEGVCICRQAKTCINMVAVAPLSHVSAASADVCNYMDCNPFATCVHTAAGKHKAGPQESCSMHL